MDTKAVADGDTVAAGSTTVAAYTAVVHIVAKSQAIADITTTMVAKTAAVSNIGATATAIGSTEELAAVVADSTGSTQGYLVVDILELQQVVHMFKVADTFMHFKLKLGFPYWFEELTEKINSILLELHLLMHQLQQMHILLLRVQLLNCQWYCFTPQSLQHLETPQQLFPPLFQIVMICSKCLPSSIALTFIPSY